MYALPKYAALQSPRDMSQHVKWVVTIGVLWQVPS